MINFMTRCIREINYEEWNSYISYGEEYNHINKVCIFFKDEINIIYLISCRESDSKNSAYLKEVIQLVHDLPKEFKLIIQNVETDDVDMIETIVNRLRQEELVK